MVPAQTVLHVDDDPSLLELSRESFRRTAGADVEMVTAASADEGMAVLDSRRVDCVVSDSISLPDGTPFVVAARRAHPEVSVVLFTGREWDDVRSDAADASVEAYVRKSDPDDFARVVDEVGALVRRNRPNGGDASTGGAPESAALPAEAGEWEFVTTHDWQADGELGTTIAIAMASYMGVAPDATEPLFPTVDADTLDALLRPPCDDAEYDVQVRFPYRSWELTVSSRGDVAIRAAAGGAAE